MMYATDVKSANTNPVTYWSHCANEWHNVATGAGMAGQLDTELFFENLSEDAAYMAALLSR